MWSLKASGMEALAGYWALENPVADRLRPRFQNHLDLLDLAAERPFAPPPYGDGIGHGRALRYNAPYQPVNHICNASPIEPVAGDALSSKPPPEPTVLLT